MLLEELNRKMGSWLFRWRSYLPLVLIIIILFGFLELSSAHWTQRQDLYWELFCFTIAMLGLFIRCYTIGHTPFGTSGRNTKRQVAESLNTTGIYSIVRNPLYLGNFFMMFGVVLSVGIWSVGLIYVLVFWLYYERIIVTEEFFLKKKFGDDYIEYANRTPVFLPNFKLWTPSRLAFSIRNALKREYSGFFGIIVSFVILDLLSNIIVLKKFSVDSVWLWIFVFGLIVYLSLRTIRKKTDWLQVEGR